MQVFLRSRPLFAGAATADLERVAERARLVLVEPGEWLFREGEPAAFVYVVQEGQLELLHEAQGVAPRQVVTELRRGAVVGELAVMRGAVRGTSVRALVSSRLLALPARDFVAFVRATPSAAMRLAEILAQRVLPIGSAESPPGEVWGLERTDDLDGELGAALARAASRPEVGVGPPSVWCTEGARVSLGKRYGLRFEPLPQRLTPPPGQVQIVIGPADHLTRLPVDLAAFISGPGATAPPGLRQGRHVRVVRAGPPARDRVRFFPGRPHEVAERVVRVLERRTIGLALGGGGALGLSHLGVLEVLARERIPIDVLVGTSAGAMVGGLVLARGLGDALEQAKRMTRTRLFTLVDPSFFVSGLIEGRRVLKYFRELLGPARIEELPIPFAALAMDLDTGEERALTGGGLAEAVRASVSLPSVFAPYVHPGEDGGPPGTYIDAGGVNNVPVDVTRELGADRTIGVNVINRPKGWNRGVAPWQNWSPVRRGKMIAYAELVGFARNGERQAYTADIPILPDTRDFGFTQFYRAEELREKGLEATERLLPQLRSLARSRP